MSEKQKTGILGSSKIAEFVKNNKSVQIAVVLLSFAIIFAIFISSLNTGQSNTNETDSTLTFEYVENLESRLSKIISCIDGAGTVNVMVALVEGSEYKFASEDEKEYFSSLIEAQTILGTDEQIVIKEVFPTIKGVVVVCSGAANVKVKLDILKAIQALLEVSSGSIEILPG